MCPEHKSEDLLPLNVRSLRLRWRLQTTVRRQDL